jgi:hypothetical protein
LSGLSARRFFVIQSKQGNAPCRQPSSGPVSCSTTQSREAFRDFEIQNLLQPQQSPQWPDPMLCVIDMEAPARAVPQLAAADHLLSSLMALERSPPLESWAASPVANEHEVMAWPTIVAAVRREDLRSSSPVVAGSINSAKLSEHSNGMDGDNVPIAVLGLDGLAELDAIPASANSRAQC